MTLTFHPIFTERETQVKELALQGKTTKEIARALDMAPNTVTRHLSSIYRKERVHTRYELRVKHYRGQKQ